MQVKLTISWRGNVEREVTLKKPGFYVIGRAEEADITISDSQMSRAHCMLEITRKGVTVEDVGSSNGTMVDGTRLQRPETNVEVAPTMESTEAFRPLENAFVPPENERARAATVLDGSTIFMGTTRIDITIPEEEEQEQEA